MANPLWVVNLIKKSFSSRFKWANWTKNKIFRKIIDNFLFKGDEIYYLPKDNVIEVNEDAGLPVSMAVPSSILHQFINKASYIFIMDKCICRDSNQCQDYPIDIGCIFLGEAGRKINKKLGREATKEDAFDHLERCKEAGLVHLIGRNKLDTVWLNIGPGTKLLTICHCCPCCCLWKMIPVLDPTISQKVSAMPGVTIEVSGKCIGCGKCMENICFVDAIELINGMAEINQKLCKGCGRCVEICPNEAIQLNMENKNVLEELSAKISALVDVT